MNTSIYFLNSKKKKKEKRKKGTEQKKRGNVLDESLCVRQMTFSSIGLYKTSPLLPVFSPIWGEKFLVGLDVFSLSLSQSLFKKFFLLIISY